MESGFSKASHASFYLREVTKTYKVFLDFYISTYTI